jgi:uncharacterized protein (TIGR03435 family)
LGPGWISEREYDIETRAAKAVSQDQMDLMLRSLIAERFKLKQHNEMREMRRYELVAGKSGPRIRPGSGEGTLSARPDFIFTEKCVSLRTCLQSS